MLNDGTDGNSLINECGKTNFAATAISFNVPGKMNADFSYNIKEGCKEDTVSFSFILNFDRTHQRWTFDDGLTSTEDFPVKYYNRFGNRKVTFFVSNDVCSDSVAKTFPLGERPKASFTVPDFLCPLEAVTFLNKSTNSTQWYWDFDNGITSTLFNPPAQYYPITNGNKIYTIQLIASDGNCVDTVYKNITVPQTCIIAAPNAFPPNGDGVNDYLYPLNSFNTTNFEFKVFNRLGQLVFQTKDWTKKWDGKLNNKTQPAGTYVWYLNYKDGSTGKEIKLKGTTVLIR